jgi:hypothetical protein
VYNIQLHKKQDRLRKKSQAISAAWIPQHTSHSGTVTSRYDVDLDRRNVLNRLGSSIDLHCSSDVIRVIKSRRMRWVGHVAGMGESRGVFWWGNLRETDHMEDPGVDERIILRWILGKWEEGQGLDLFGSG